MFKWDFYFSFQYSIKGGNQDRKFLIDSGTGQIQTSGPLDREEKSSYQLSIIAQDNNEKCHKGLMTLYVNVGDDDDNIPKFEKNIHYASVREDISSGQYVIQVALTFIFHVCLEILFLSKDAMGICRNLLTVYLI